MLFVDCFRKGFVRLIWSIGFNLDDVLRPSNPRAILRIGYILAATRLARLGKLPFLASPLDQSEMIELFKNLPDWNPEAFRERTCRNVSIVLHITPWGHRRHRESTLQMPLATEEAPNARIPYPSSFRPLFKTPATYHRMPPRINPDLPLFHYVAVAPDISPPRMFPNGSVDSDETSIDYR